MIRIFINQKIDSSNPLIIENNNLHYIKNVMRLQNNDTLNIFNKNQEWESIILNIKKGIVLPQKVIKTQTAIKYNISIACCMIKRMQFIIEKATEIGVDNIYPIISDHSFSRFNLEKANIWAKEAIEQSNQLSPPVIHSPIKLHNIKDNISENLYLLHQDGLNIQNFTFPNNNINIVIMIGPEGGFSKQEDKYLNDLPKIKISNNILRAETAVISGLSMFKCLV